MKALKFTFIILIILLIKQSEFEKVFSHPTKIKSSNNSSNVLKINCRRINFKQFQSRDVMKAKFSFDRLTQTIKATFICKDGYTLKFHSTRNNFNSTNCINGTWYYTSQPFCYKKCEPPSLEIEHGKDLYIDLSSTFETILYLCDKGYMIADGDYFNTCYDQYWTNDNATCVPIPADRIMQSCQPIQSKKPTKISYSDGLNHGSVATFSCEKGFHLLKNLSQTYCIDGKFEPIRPICVEDRCKMPKLSENLIALFPYDRNDYQVQVYFTCKNGFSLLGPSRSKCERGIWKPNINRKCNFTSIDYKKCSAIRPRINITDQDTNPIITYSSNDFKHTTIATHFCPKGFNAFGPRFKMCIDGVWQPQNLSECSMRPLFPVDEDILPNIGVYSLQPTF